MKLILESTTKVVELVVNGAAVPARVWEGHTESGIPVHCFITRVGVREEHDQGAFEHELRECRAPSAEVAEFPLRLIL